MGSSACVARFRFVFVKKQTKQSAKKSLGNNSSKNNNNSGTGSCLVGATWGDRKRTSITLESRNVHARWRARGAEGALKPARLPGDRAPVSLGSWRAHLLEPAPNEHLSRSRFNAGRTRAF